MHHDPKTEEDRHREAAAVTVARSMARSLRGLPQHELCRLSQRFLSAFLAELHRNGQADPATLIQLAHLPLDMMLGGPGLGLEEPQPAPTPPGEAVLKT